MSAQVAPVGYTAGTSFAWNTQGQVISAATVLPALGIVGVALRIWSRFHKRTGFGLDDVFILPALICVIGLGVTLLFGVAKDVIAHTTPPNPNADDPEAQLYQNTPEQVLVEKIEFISFLLTVAAYGCIKLSVLFFYRRIFVKGTSRAFDIVTKASIAITAVWMIVFFLLQLFMCGRHIDWNWGPFIELEKCVDGFTYNNALFVSDLITDVLVICLPIPLILQLQLLIQRKFAIIGILLLGSISVVAAIIRLVFSFQGAAAGDALPTDVDEAITTLLYWSMLEAGISLIATNLPSIYFLFSKESLQSFANSIRNVVSLDSLRSSQRSNSDTGCQSLYSKKKNASKTSHVTTSAKKEWEPLEGVNTFAMYDMEPSGGVNKPEAVHAAGNMGDHGDMV